MKIPLDGSECKVLQGFKLRRTCCGYSMSLRLFFVWVFSILLFWPLLRSIRQPLDGLYMTGGKQGSTSSELKGTSCLLPLSLLFEFGMHLAKVKYCFGSHL